MVKIKNLLRGKIKAKEKRKLLCSSWFSRNDACTKELDSGPLRHSAVLIVFLRQQLWRMFMVRVSFEK